MVLVFDTGHYERDTMGLHDTEVFDGAPSVLRFSQVRGLVEASVRDATVPEQLTTEAVGVTCDVMGPIALATRWHQLTLSGWI
jgi:hypothetical protein